jgi:GTP-binding protein Era
VLALLPPGTPALLVANKLDALPRRQDVLPWLQQMQQAQGGRFAEYVPMSATRAADVERLLAIVEPYLPEQPWLHEEDALTDRDERFLASEIVREKLFRLTGDELPYTSTVVIETFEEEGDEAGGRRVRIAAGIVVERDAHKGMVIGAGGERLKRIGTEARHELERLLGARVHLELWVKVRSGWADDEAHLRSYGYE